MIRRVPHWLLAVGIVTAVSGCDNVSWGGVDLRLQGPSDSLSSDVSAPEAPAASVSLPTLGPLLYAAVRVGDSLRAQPVGELGPEGLVPFPEGPLGDTLREVVVTDRLAPGRELTLFAEGARVGTLILGGAPRPASGHCAPRLEAFGLPELIPGAEGAQHFLALEADRTHGLPRESPELLRDEYEHRVASLDLGSAGLSRTGARWPPSLLDIRQDIRVFRLEGTSSPAVMATFLHRDRLAVGTASTDAYSLMVLGEAGGGGYDLSYAWYRPVEAEGKGAPRYFSHLDWDGDGREEILLEVLGAASRWWASLERGPQGWDLAFQDPCGAPGGGA